MAINNIIIASGSVIIENNKVLLVKHGEDNKWKFPGGKVKLDKIQDWENSLEQTATREAKEELDINIKIIKPLKPMLIRKPDIDSKHIMLIHYLAHRIGEINPSADIKQWNWFTLDNLPADCNPNIRSVLKNIKSNDTDNK